MSQATRFSVYCFAALALFTGRTEAAWRVDLGGGAIVPASSVEFGHGADTASSDFDVGGSLSVGAGYGLGERVDLTAHFQADFTDLNVVRFEDSLDVYSPSGSHSVSMCATTTPSTLWAAWSTSPPSSPSAYTSTSDASAGDV